MLCVIFSALKLSYLVFKHTDKLSESLQAAGLNCADGTDMAEGVKTQLIALRSDSKFKEFWDDVEKETEALGKFYLNCNVNSAILFS